MSRSRRKKKRANQHCHCWLCEDPKVKKKELGDKADRRNCLDTIREARYGERDDL